MSITIEELQSMTEFFSKQLLGIRYKGEIEFMSSKFEDDYTGELRKNPFLGSFEHHENSYDIDIDNDDCFDVGICHGENDIVYEDYPINYKPNTEDCTIYISESIREDKLRLIDTLLHELIHFKLWYQGLDYKDGDYQFEQALKEYGVSSNYDRVFDYKAKRWKEVVNIDKIKTYEQLYQNYIKTK